MKVVALVSGGKDSCFNMLHCVSNGHEIIAIANLSPPKHIDELDSYMYQTVGHEMINLYSQAMDVPLFQQTISGTSIQVSSTYTKTTNDEVEDLYTLLKKVRDVLPDVQGVSVGAILSDYQRVRVEDVCNRLGLISLSYLWRQDQLKLLDTMIKCNMDCILVKVASLGLNRNHLMKNLKEMQPLLEELNSKFGVHPCGEGGEYESMTQDCPLFKKRIIVYFLLI